MNYILLFLLSLSTLLSASTFEWKSTNSAPTVSNPMEKISKLIESDMAKVIYTRDPIDLSTAVPVKVVKPKLPQEVKKPQLPPAIKLTRGEFEPTAAFNRRVQEASSKRDRLLHELQEEYRLKVLAHNKKVEALSAEYNAQLKKRNHILERLQEIQKKDAQSLNEYFKAKEAVALTEIDVFAARAVDSVFGQAKLSYISYNPDSELMHIRVSSYDGKNFSKKIAIKVKPANAKKLKEALSTLTPLVVFDIEIDAHSSVAFAIKEISVTYKTTEYVATDSTTDYRFKPTYVTIDNTTDFATKSSALALENTHVQFALQNPNLNDKKYRLGAVALTADGAIIGVNEQVNEVRALSSVKKDATKWLFMIAIEKYAETDNVIYADRSANSLKAVLQKRLGIPKQNTFALFDKQATSGAIKDKLKRMLSRVKRSDTIYFYYSGHGVPSKSGEAYILPSDKVVDFIDDDPFFKLANIYTLLSHSKAKHSFAFVDACFSGKTDGIALFKGVAPGLIRTKKTPYDEKKLTILTAGLDDEFSNMYEEKKYRLFSYFLTQALIEGVRDVSLLYKKVNVNVLQHSRKMGSRYEQSPQLYGNRQVRIY